MNNFFKILFSVGINLLLLFSCATYRQEMYSEGGMEEMFRNAVIDFVHTEDRLLRKDDFFHVFLLDSQKVCIIGDNNKTPLIIEVPDRSNIVYQWSENGVVVSDSVLNRTIISVDWSRSEENPRIWFDENAVRKSYRSFPDGVYEHGEKLFFWNLNPRPQAIDTDIVETLYRYNYVDTLVDKAFWPHDVIDDGKKGIVYSFPYSDLRVFNKYRE